jgi:UDP-N-acetylmuramate dehydrogenase
MDINIKQNIPLAPHTTFKIGGLARFFVEVFNEKEVIWAVDYAHNNKLKVFILGGGSNTLISDNGFNGLVIKIRSADLVVNNTEIICAAGVPLIKLVKYSIKNNLTGLEWAAGIPGTAGGAVRGNAGAFGGEMGDLIEKVKVLKINNSTSEIEFYKSNECNFTYRNSIFKQNENLIILELTIKLARGVHNKSEKIMNEIIKRRTNSQPTEANAGSFFKNPTVFKDDIIEKFEHDTGKKMLKNKLPAGWLIDDLGLRSKKIGKAQVSEKHANFIINTGGAKAEDVIILSSLLKQKVRDHFGIQLEEEVSRIGF